VAFVEISYLKINVFFYMYQTTIALKVKLFLLDICK